VDGRTALNDTTSHDSRMAENERQV
jgi:hypothetical protein